MNEDTFQTQVVILVDVNQRTSQETCTKTGIDEKDVHSTISKDSEDRTKAVSLSTYRLLTYFVNKVKQELKDNHSKKQSDSFESKTKSSNISSLSNSFKWGFKLFDSKNHKSKVENTHFRSFKQRHLDIFESELDKRFNVETADLLQSQSLSRTRSLQSENISRALTEVVQDFPWELHDILSPCRDTHRVALKKRLSLCAKECELIQRHNNFIFLFCDCPDTEELQRSFVGKKVLDEHVFLDSFVPVSLLDKFKNSPGIALFWINTAYIHSVNEQISGPAASCLEKINKALYHVNGCLIPLAALVHTRTDHQSGCEPSVANIIEQRDKLIVNSKQKCAHRLKTLANAIPISSILDSYILDLGRNREFQLTVPFSARPAIDESRGLPACKLIAVVKDSLTQVCFLELEPFVRNEKCQPVKSDCTRRRSSLSTSTISQPITSDISLQHAHFHMMGTISASKPISLLLRNGDHCYTCCGYIQKDHVLGVKNQTVMEQCPTFKKMIGWLMTNKEYLLLQVHVPGAGKDCNIPPQLALLKPHTHYSAGITVLSLTDTLTLEKLLRSECPAGPAEVPSSEVAGKGTSRAACEQWRQEFIENRLRRGYRSDVSNERPGTSSRDECFNSQCLETWYPPGYGSLLGNLIGILEQRDCALANDERKLLSQLRSVYKKENMSLLQHTGSTPQYNEYVTNAKPVQAGALVVSSDQSEASSAPTPIKRLRSSTSTVPSRGERLVSKGMKIAKTKEESNEKRRSLEEQKRLDAPEPMMDKLKIESHATAFGDDDGLSEYIRQIYNQALEEQLPVTGAVQTIVLVIMHHMKSQHRQNTQMSVKEFLQQDLILSSAALREKYLKVSQAVDTRIKVLEYQLQIELQLETASIEPETKSLTDEDIEEIVMMLRTLSFAFEPTFLSSYMEDTLVTNYLATLPKSLEAIYDELMQPLPDVLANLLSPSAADHSANHSILDHSAGGSVHGEEFKGPMSADLMSLRHNSNQPMSNKSDSTNNRTLRSKPLLHHPSLADIGPKRQIMIEKKNTKKSAQTKEKAKRRLTASAKKKLKLKAKKTKEGAGEMQAVRRNLFMTDPPKLARSQSMVSPPRRASLNTAKSPSRKLKGQHPPTHVSDTPFHKQMLRTRFMKPSSTSGPTAAASEVPTMPLSSDIVVEESPEKIISSDSSSPKKKFPGMAALRRSFYSAGPQSQSRNTQKYRQLADRIAGRTPTPSVKQPVTSDPKRLSICDLKSPVRKFVMKQLKGSPSPNYNLRKTPTRDGSHTPSKLVLESPGYSLRVRSPSVGSSVRAMLFSKSPKRSEPQNSTKHKTSTPVVEGATSTPVRRLAFTNSAGKSPGRKASQKDFVKLCSEGFIPNSLSVHYVEFDNSTEKLQGNINSHKNTNINQCLLSPTETCGGITMGSYQNEYSGKRNSHTPQKTLKQSAGFVLGQVESTPRKPTGCCVVTPRSILKKTPGKTPAKSNDRTPVKHGHHKISPEKSVSFNFARGSSNKCQSRVLTMPHKEARSERQSPCQHMRSHTPVKKDNSVRQISFDKELLSDYKSLKTSPVSRSRKEIRGTLQRMEKLSKCTSSTGMSTPESISANQRGVKLSSKTSPQGQGDLKQPLSRTPPPSQKPKSTTPDNWPRRKPCFNKMANIANKSSNSSQIFSDKHSVKHPTVALTNSASYDKVSSPRFTRGLSKEIGIDTATFKAMSMLSPEDKVSSMAVVKNTMGSKRSVQISPTNQCKQRFSSPAKRQKLQHDTNFTACIDNDKLSLSNEINKRTKSKAKQVEDDIFAPRHSDRRETSPVDSSYEASSEGFDTTALSNVSSVNYFSANNSDIFLPTYAGDIHPSHSRPIELPIGRTFTLHQKSNSSSGNRNLVAESRTSEPSPPMSPVFSRTQPLHTRETGSSSSECESSAKTRSPVFKSAHKGVMVERVLNSPRVIRKAKRSCFPSFTSFSQIPPSEGEAVFNSWNQSDSPTKSDKEAEPNNIYSSPQPPKQLLTNSSLSAKKYSPNVTSIGLLQLMNSPILASGVKRKTDTMDENCPSSSESTSKSVKRQRTAHRSRRSLQLTQ